MLNVLWLCSWYPNSIDELEGKAVQRYAQAASEYNRIHVIKLTPDPTARGVNKITRTFQQWPNLTEIFIYYPKPATLIGKTISYLRWYSLYKYAVESYIEKNGKPDLLHVHVPYKAGAIAKMISRKYKIPYVITEHWNGYNEEGENNYKERELSFRNLVKETLKNASALHCVSDYTGRQINKLVYKIPYTVIPNAVDTRYFNYQPIEKSESKFRLVHFSGGTPVENISGVIEAFNKLPSAEFDFTVIGLPEEQNQLFEKLHSGIRFVGKVSYQEVADYLTGPDALVMFSNIENSQVVIAEALCCGLPVVATEVGGMAELVDTSNGILVPAGDIARLVDSIRQIKIHATDYDRKAISEDAADRFSYAQTGFELDLWYKSVLMSIASGPL